MDPLPSAALTFSWGRGRDGVLGTGDEEREDAPVSAPRRVGNGWAEGGQRPPAGGATSSVCSVM